MITERGSLTVRAGGWALILGAVAFMAVFSYLAARFDYPAILDGPAETVLPHLLATGATGRAVWAIYAFLPLLWIPAGVGACLAFRRSHPGAAARAPMRGGRRAQHDARPDALADDPLAAGRAVRDARIRRSARCWRAVRRPQYLPGQLHRGVSRRAGFNAFFLLSSWAMLRSRVAPRGWR